MHGYLNHHIHVQRVDIQFLPNKTCSKNRSKLDTMCYAKYNNHEETKENMGCADVYDYTSRIPLSRYLTR